MQTKNLKDDHSTELRSLTSLKDLERDTLRQQLEAKIRDLED